MLFDLRPSQLVQPPVGLLGEPVLDQLLPVGLTHGRPSRGHPRGLRRRQVLPDRLAVQPERRRQLRLRAARVPVNVDLHDVRHAEGSPRHPDRPSTSRLAGRGTPATPSRPGPSTRHRHAPGEPDRFAKGIYRSNKPPDTGKIFTPRRRPASSTTTGAPLGNRPSSGWGIAATASGGKWGFKPSSTLLR